MKSIDSMDSKSDATPFSKTRIVGVIFMVLIPGFMVFSFYAGGHGRASLPAILNGRNFPQIPLMLITPLAIAYYLVRSKKKGRVLVIIWSCLVFAMTCVGRWPGTFEEIEIAAQPETDAGVAKPQEEKPKGQEGRAAPDSPSGTEN